MRLADTESTIGPNVTCAQILGIEPRRQCVTRLDRLARSTGRLSEPKTPADFPMPDLHSLRAPAGTMAILAEILAKPNFSHL
jgi:hypothetical protein